jgi:prepilin-type N-terminal cleavage/methylation domain-containing protein
MGKLRHFFNGIPTSTKEVKKELKKNKSGENSMKLTKNRKQNGFTMIEIMVVVVIVAILAAIAIPTYVEYVKGAYASEAKSVIGNIDNASKMYFQTYGEWPGDVEELERSGQLEVDRSTKLKWTFALSLSDDGGQITAESTEEMKGGPGRLVVFDRARGRYLGYGSPDENQ